MPGTSDDADLAGAIIDKGRRHHLGRLGHIFYRRGATWSDFGAWLDDLFSGNQHKKGLGFHVQRCRHDPQVGRHGRILRGIVATQLQTSHPVFTSEGCFMPCRSFGKGEEGKATGMIVDDLVRRARDYLSSIGRGEIMVSSSLDAEYGDTGDTTEEESSSDDLEEEGTEGSLYEELVDLAGFSRSSVPYQTPLDLQLTIALEDIQVEGFDPRDSAVEASERLDTIMSDISGFQSSESAFDPNASRSSTKIRVATLAYLHKFSQRPVQLRTAFRTLRNTELCVLHLCGCGVKFHDRDSGQDCAGCVERTHLKLGDPSENRTHLIWHKAMSVVSDPNYVDLCRIVHDTPLCDGLF